MIEIRHGAHTGAFAGQGMQAAQAASEFVREADRREKAFQLDQQLAEQQVALTQQRAELEQRAFDLEAEDRVWDRFFQTEGNRLRTREADRRDELLRLETERLQQSTELERQAEARRGKALDLDIRSLEMQLGAQELGLDRDRARQAFNTMRAAGVDPSQMRTGLRVAGEVLGGGLGAGLSVLADMPPSRAAVFARLSPENQERFLADEAERQVLAGRERRRAAVPVAVQHLQGIGLLDENQALDVVARLGDAEEDHEVQAIIDELGVLQGSYVERQTVDAGRERLLEQITTRERQMGELVASADDLSGGAEGGLSGMRGQLGELSELRSRLAVDPSPDFEAYQREFRAIAAATPPQEGLSALGAPIDLDAVRSRILSGEPPAAPAPQPETRGYIDWLASAPGAQDLDAELVHRAALIEASPDLSEREKALQFDRWIAGNGFDASDPLFVAEVEKEVERLKKERREAQRDRKQEQRSSRTFRALDRAGTLGPFN